jgi:tetratricopeptide (TPR) repeat protein
MRQLTRALARTGSAQDSAWPALLTAALWLLHPINLTPVLYVVQRMTSLSALFVLTALWCHVTGRLWMAAGDRRGLWLALAGLPLAAVGGLAKESAALYPLMVLVLEWTLLRRLSAPGRRALIAVVAVLPILAGTLYLLSHPQLLGYGSRDFTLEQRLLSEARALWLYLRMLLLPDPTVLGFYHDDFALSTGLTTPWTTLPAVLGWSLLLPAALLAGRRYPVASFALLFYLAAHAMESTIFPLELVFEHRNYLAALGPVFALAWLLSGQAVPSARKALAAAAVTLLLALAAVTHLRALDWSSEQRLILTEVSHHPGSARAQFRTAQMLMDELGRTEGEQQARIYLAARHHLDQVRQLDPTNLNALFGRMMLELFVGRDPDPAVVDELIDGLRNGVLGPTKLSISQFTYLVRWQMADGHPLTHQRALEILHAPLDNRSFNTQGRAAVLSTIRAYHERVLNDPARALDYAQQAVRTWPRRWHYHYRLVKLLIRLDRRDEADAAYRAALQQPTAALHPAQVQELAQALATQPSSSPAP